MPAEESSPGKPTEDLRNEKGGFSSPRWRVVMVLSCVVVAALLVIIVPTAVVLTRTDRLDPVCPAMDERERVDCHPEGEAARARCEARGCCWSPAATQGPPSCFYPTNHGYEVDGEVVKTASGYRARLRRLKSPPTPYSADVETLEVVVEMQEEHRLHVKILDPAEARYEVPEAALRVPRPGQAADSPMYDVIFAHRPFSFKVTRRSTGATIFDTSVSKLTFGDQFLSVSTRLASSNLYGLGEHVHRRYRHDLNWKTWPIFSRGASPKGNFDNLYGHHPFYMCLEDSDGNANGVFLLNSNAMEVTLQPPVTSVKSQIRDDILDVERVAMPTVTYRVIGGVLDFYMFLGPSPENVVQQYTEMIGRSIMPAYWALGFQLSRWNYTDINKLRRVVQRTRDTGIPYDVQYGDIDYMEDTKDFTYDADLFQGLPDLVQNLHDHGQKYIIILDPAIGNTNRRDGSPYLPYESGLQDDVFVKNADGVTDLIGEVWPGTTVFPDFTKPSTVQWWGDHCESFHNVIPYDGLWIDMNEPKTFKNGSLTGCGDDRWNYPPYVPAIKGKLMYERTLCMDTLQYWGRHYDVHSLYGHSMAIATHSAMRRVFPDKRGIIITRANFVGTGQYSGHWLGDNKSAWEDMEWSITGSYRANFAGTGQYSGHWLGDNKSAWEDMEWSITGSYRANFVGTGQYSGHWLGDNKSAWEDMEWSITGKVLTGLTSWGRGSTPGTGWGITSPHGRTWSGPSRANFVGTGQYSGHWLGDNKSAWEDMEWSITGSYRANFVGTGQYSGHWLGDNKSAWEDMEWSITGSYRANFVGTGQYSGHWLGDNKSAWEDMEWSITGSYRANFVGTGQYSGHWLGDNKSAWEDMEWSITGSYRANFVGTGQYSGHWLGDNKSAWEDMEWSITGSYRANFVGTGQYSGHWLGDNKSAWEDMEWSITGTGQYSGHWLGDNKSAWEDMEWSITGSYRANFVGTGQYSGHWLGDNKSAWEDMEWSITGSYRANFVGTGQYSGHWLGDNKSAWEDMDWSITGSYRANFVGTGQYSGHWLGDNKSAWEDMDWSITGSYRANFVGTGQYSGHWLGDNKSAWEDMEWSITGMLEFGLFGIPYIGADICGFLLDTTEQLCQRWMQLGAFYPYSRNHNHNDFIDQDPAVFSQSMIDSSRDVMMTRYTLLPYLYTLFYHAHVAGTTVVRPLLHEFPTDSNTWDVDRQFLWGSGLLISPVLTPDTTTVDAYFPDTPWYAYFTGQEVEGQYRGQTVTLDAPLDKINVHVRGGVILPTQQPANTTVYSRKNPMGLLVAMDDSSAASGTLFWDDGESIDSVERQDYVFVNFNASSTELLCEVVNVPLGGPTAGHWADLRYGTVSVYGLALGTGTPIVRAGPSNGPLQTVATSRVQYDRDNQVLLLTDLNDMDLKITSSLRVTWG
ncbi:MGAM [Branchiostoma lanceolatum]|uniref:alpha-glucosidase n=1 Tax=Branchiostoma lanceolatum TaxID=7740 RepID=A0A8J9Z189_BRALA|nr:MGAM [Branchiostoma lanceolatum]